MKLKFDDFQQTTQEHVWPRLNKADLIATARKTWDERRGGRGVRLVGLHVTLLDPQMERTTGAGIMNNIQIRNYPAWVIFSNYALFSFELLR